MAKFHHDTAFESAVWTSSKLPAVSSWVSYIYTDRWLFTSLGNGWIAIFIIRRIGAVY